MCFFTIVGHEKRNEWEPLYQHSDNREDSSDAFWLARVFYECFLWRDFLSKKNIFVTDTIIDKHSSSHEIGTRRSREGM